MSVFHNYQINNKPLSCASEAELQRWVHTFHTQLKASDEDRNNLQELVESQALKLKATQDALAQSELELEAVKIQNEQLHSQSTKLGILEALQSATDKGFNEGIEAAANVIDDVQLPDLYSQPVIDEVAESIRALKRKEV